MKYDIIYVYYLYLESILNTVMHNRYKLLFTYVKRLPISLIKTLVLVYYKTND